MIKDKVSIIVPVFNAERYLERTIEYLRNQTYENIEIILVDDGSTDSSPQICDKACKEDERIKCIHKQNAGVSAARNDGMNAAIGEYIMFCDADDIPSERWVQRFYEVISISNSDNVISGYYAESHGLKTEYIYSYDKIIGRNHIQHRIIMTMSMWGYAPNNEKLERVNGGIWNRIYKKELIEKNGLVFDEKVIIAEDVLFNIEYLNCSEKVVFIEECLYTYIFNPESATHSNYEKQWMRFITTWKQINNALKKCNVRQEDLRWHNYQFKKYAITSIIEGVCSANEGVVYKRNRIIDIVSESSLQQALKTLPKEIGIKDKCIAFLLRRKWCFALLVYYQIIYEKYYRRRIQAK